MRTLIIILVVELFSVIASAQTLEQVKHFRAAAINHNVPVNKLIKIAYVESHFKANAVRYNKNGTMDVGLMQINSIHWDTTCKEYDVTTVKGNINCGAKILAGHKGKMAIDKCWYARYHSKTLKFKERYCDKLANVPTKVLIKLADK